jgi:hypothetical protein
MSLESNGTTLEEKPLLEEISTTATRGDDEKREEVVVDDLRSPIRKMDIGVWRIFYQSSTWEFVPGAETLRRLRETAKDVSYVGCFLKNLWEIAPGYLVLWFVLELWASMQNAASLWVKARMLQTVHNALRSTSWYPCSCFCQLQDIVSQKEVDANALRMTLGLKFLQIVSEGVYKITEHVLSYSKYIINLNVYP